MVILPDGTVEAKAIYKRDSSVVYEIAVWYNGERKWIHRGYNLGGGETYFSLYNHYPRWQFTDVQEGKAVACKLYNELVDEEKINLLNAQSRPYIVGGCPDS